MVEERHTHTTGLDEPKGCPYAFFPDLLDPTEKAQDAVVVSIGAQLLETLDVEHFEWKLTRLVVSGAVIEALDQLASFVEPVIAKVVRDGVADDDDGPVSFPAHVFGDDMESMYRAADRLALMAFKSAINFRRLIDSVFAAQGQRMIPAASSDTSDFMVSPTIEEVYTQLQRATAAMFAVRAAALANEGLPGWLARELMHTWIIGTRSYLALLGAFGIEPAKSEIDEEDRIDLGQLQSDHFAGQWYFEQVARAYAIAPAVVDEVQRTLLVEPTLGAFLLEARSAIETEFSPDSDPWLARTVDFDSDGSEQLVIYVPTDCSVDDALRQIRRFRSGWWRQHAPDDRVLVDLEHVDALKTLISSDVSVD